LKVQGWSWHLLSTVLDELLPLHPVLEAIQDDGGESIIRSAPNSGGRSVGMRAIAVLLFATSIGIGLVVIDFVRYLLLAFQAVTSGLVDITITFLQ
jgi:hypothetical protein